jgi:hypothetical protein
MYGRLDWSSLLSSSKTMASAARCGGRQSGTRAAAREGTREEEEGSRGMVGWGTNRCDPTGVRERLVLVSARARADWPPWHLTGGPELSDRASIRIKHRFSLICNGLAQSWY